MTVLETSARPQNTQANINQIIQVSKHSTCQLWSHIDWHYHMIWSTSAKCRRYVKRDQLLLPIAQFTLYSVESEDIYPTYFVLVMFFSFLTCFTSWVTVSLNDITEDPFCMPSIFWESFQLSSVNLFWHLCVPRPVRISAFHCVLPCVWIPGWWRKI